MLLSIIEIALLIIMPLLIFFQGSKWRPGQYIPVLFFIYLIWYLTYAPLHEIMHLLGAWTFQKEIYEIKLIPAFWKGEFGTAFIEYDYQADRRDFVIILLPYLKDILFLFIGFMLFQKKKIKSAFVLGLILILFIFSPLYDIANNYIAYLTGHMNDFNALSESGSKFLSHSLGIIFSLISLLAGTNIIRNRKIILN